MNFNNKGGEFELQETDRKDNAADRKEFDFYRPVYRCAQESVLLFSCPIWSIDIKGLVSFIMFDTFFNGIRYHLQKIQKKAIFFVRRLLLLKLRSHHFCVRNAEYFHPLQWSVKNMSFPVIYIMGK